MRNIIGADIYAEVNAKVTTRFLRRVLGAFCCLAVFQYAPAQQPSAMPQIHLQQVPQIGDQLIARDLPINPASNQCLANSAQFDPCAEAVIEGVRYTIAFRKRKNRDYVVTRVYTGDATFKSPEGMRVGDMITANGPEDIFEAPYFEVYARKGTRWIPVIGVLGMVNLSLDEKGLAMEKVWSLWSGGRKPVQFRIQGFIEQKAGS